MMVNQTQSTILLIDIGNSSLKWALSDSSDSNDLMDMSHQQYPENISSAFFEEYWQDLEKPSEIIASCVASDSVWLALEKACDELWKIKVQRIESLKEGFGLVNAYEDVSSLGSDRWCAMIGGQHSTDKAFIVIDAGSALTIDVVNESGKHLGGYILPGIGMMKKSLGIHTAQVQFEDTKSQLPPLSLGSSTKDCVEAGIHLSIVKLIETVFEKESKQLENCQVYITGGDAQLIASLLSFKCVIIPALVLQGLSVISTSNFKNN